MRCTQFVQAGLKKVYGSPTGLKKWFRCKAFQTKIFSVFYIEAKIILRHVSFPFSIEEIKLHLSRCVDFCLNTTMEIPYEIRRIYFDAKFASFQEQI